MVLSNRENNDNKWMVVMNKDTEILEIFPEGVMVESTIGEGGPSEVFVGGSGDTQPFSYLGDYNPEHFRIVTKEEIDEELMISWFANAIETAKDSIHNG